MLDPGWKPDSVADIMRIVIELFGPDRCMIGTNLPIDKLRGKPSRLLAACLAGLGSFNSDDKAAILGQYGRKVLSDRSTPPSVDQLLV